MLILNSHYRKAVGWAFLTATQTLPIWAGPLEKNRGLIVLDQNFPADQYILDQTCLMIELYHRMDEHDALFFDAEAPQVVLDRISIRNLKPKPAEDSLANALASVKRRILDLTDTPVAAWTEEQRNLRKAFPPEWTRNEVRASESRIIFRRGMRRTFRRSLENASPYQEFMDSSFQANGIPTRLQYLAHVESRFQSNAVSAAGAAGIWQFLQKTGSRYLVIDDNIDQRLDPQHATTAAAQYLKRCRKQMTSWPLAIMAYNNGLGQMHAAVQETGSRNPSEIIQNFQGNRFGKVSKNYYAMFLAASSLGLKADSLYPSLRKRPTIPVKSLKLVHAWTPIQLRVLSGYSTEVIRCYNPSLRPVVFEKNLPVPRGFELKLPVGLPSSEDLKFSDLLFSQDLGTFDASPVSGSFSGFPLPKFAENSLRKLRKYLFPGTRRHNLPVLSYMQSQGLLDADCLALAKSDQILIEPHPVLQAMLKENGG